MAAEDVVVALVGADVDALAASMGAAAAAAAAWAVEEVKLAEATMVQRQNYEMQTEPNNVYIMFTMVHHVHGPTIRPG